MPHKVNPIRFENAEANLEVSNALLDVLGSTLVTSRLQRDLTDSSMQRNIAFAHSLLALDNVLRGLAGLDAVPEAMAADLDANWEVLGEPVQSAMRVLGAGRARHGQPYERLKDLTRGRRITGDDLREFVCGTGPADDVAKRLSEMTLATYIGVARSSSTTSTEDSPPIPGLAAACRRGIRRMRAETQEWGWPSARRRVRAGRTPRSARPCP